MTDDRGVEAGNKAALSLPPGGHACLFYGENPLDQLALLLPFIRAGLTAGEQVVYVADDIQVSALREGLAEASIDVEGVVARAQLRILTRDEWRQPGRLDTDAKSRQVLTMIDAAAASGFNGIRFSIEMTWTLYPSIEAAPLYRWESRLNEILQPGLPVRMVCQYNQSKLSSDSLQAALATHPHVALAGGLYANSYYAPNKEPFDTTIPFDWKVAQMRWGASRGGGSDGPSH